jgi:hypothetical protein
MPLRIILLKGVNVTADLFIKSVEGALHERVVPSMAGSPTQPAAIRPK